ncbi:MAG: hypothetical protein LBK42_10300 [Propionibacteriaceae bacterium]|jgi:hypothetical protein|nr:hypothetical protein [Propionibacteriaceae bacterium]
MIDNAALDKVREALGPMNPESGSIEAGEIATDALVLVRTRPVGDMNESGLVVLVTDGTDYITRVGLLRWATLLAEDMRGGPDD